MEQCQQRKGRKLADIVAKRGMADKDYLSDQTALKQEIDAERMKAEMDFNNQMAAARAAASRRSSGGSSGRKSSGSGSSAKQQALQYAWQDFTKSLQNGDTYWLGENKDALIESIGQTEWNKMYEVKRQKELEYYQNAGYATKPSDVYAEDGYLQEGIKWQKSDRSHVVL